MQVPPPMTWRATRLKCECGGYHFPHRKGGGACIHSPRSAYYTALRNGASDSEAQAELWCDKLELMIPEPAC